MNHLTTLGASNHEFEIKCAMPWGGCLPCQRDAPLPKRHWEVWLALLALSDG